MSFLVEALVFLVAALIVVPVCKRLGLSSVLGYLGAGVLIGPSGLALISNATEVLHFAELGVVLLLFIIGLELRPRRLWVMRRAVFGLGTAQVLVTAVALTGLLGAVTELSWVAAGVVGFALALSSTAFVLQLLGEQHKIATPHGRSAFGVLLLQDVAVIPAIVLLSVVTPGAGGPSLWVSAMTVLAFVALRFVLRPVLRFIASAGIHELFIAAGLVLVVGSALGMQAAGLSMGLGAFVAGMMVADSEYRHQLETDITPFKSLLLGLFFMAVGMSANLDLLATSPWLFLGLAAALVAVKGLIVLPLSVLHGLEWREAIRNAVLLSQGGEFAFVLLTLGASALLIDPALLEASILVVTLSMATTPLLVVLAERFLREDAETRPFDAIEATENPVVIAGFGRFAQIVARVLTMRSIPFTGLEANPGQVDFVRGFGNEVHYGDPTRLDTLRAAHIEKARAFVVAINDTEGSLRLVEHVRELAPDVLIMARALNRQHEIALRETGVDYVIRETLASSLELAEALLVALGDRRDEARDAIRLFREHDAQTLARQEAVSHDEHAFRQTTREAAEELKSLFEADRGRD